MGKRDIINLNQKHKPEISSSPHHHHLHQQPPLDYLFQSATSNSSFGSRAMLSFGNLSGVNKSGTSFYVQDEYGDEYMEDYFNQPDKKRRLSLDQIHFLEKNFEMENKLEPDRKLQLAKDLGLQPRQIAVWFQNRKTRWKTKNMEMEYETLNASYESLKTNYDNLVKENEKLKIEVLNLKQEETKDLGVEALKNDEQSSAKSDVTDAESPRLGDGIQSCSLIESGDSSLVFEIDPNEELLQPGYIFSNTQEPANSCYYGFQVEDHAAFSFWSN